METGVLGSLYPSKEPNTTHISLRAGCVPDVPRRYPTGGGTWMATVRLTTVIERSSSGESYFIYDPVHGQQGFAPDSPAWFTWLSQRTSFHFTGKHGHLEAAWRDLLVWLS
jgi:hypothetical protein